ncbi:Sulfate/thiosulfate import ATP-binding protein CysA 2 [uncultured Alphaproteobacteria bacterium]|uniref:Sulfate/thiosulfate import ATP-binding protein CysA 2 n=1 Tax=uncultured Alphaproteobacteria bacterium TaxID=91750 RepID=A0A212JV79_9PROT|nr:Sulfate/thiosulfate import ATP-binding protein CysA 2 [uncultured Alphaproteobacteria bacterium]
MQSTTIQLSRCGKTFADGTRALAPLDLEIAAGETVVLLGPSGCGKTTLLRLIAGLESPDPGGAVRFNGEDVTARPIERREVGMVFQSYALFPNLSVRDNVAYGLRVRRLPKPEIAARTDEMLEMMAIAPLAGRRVQQLSGGQRQRVALARAIAVRPRVLLLDEPLAALDAVLRDRLRVEIDALLRRLAITAVYVTHDQAEAMMLGDRIVVMSGGRIEQAGTAREIYRAPATPFVADFVGTVSRVADLAGGAALLRPEDLEICAVAEGRIAATVETAHFLGGRCLIALSGPDGTRLTAETPPDAAPVAGARVGLRWRDAAVIRIPLMEAAQ